VVRNFRADGGGTGEGLHAKVLVADRSAALVGSSNLTFHGLVSSHELAVLVRGPLAGEIADRIDMLARSALTAAFY
jgi:phosphatidylserine/phosphatidylglycerophosphate/cardiolipin synthase-like enzyme